MNELGPNFATVEMVAAAGVVVIFAIFLLALGRYFTYRETLHLHEHSADPTAYLQSRERWQYRWGKLYGVRMMVVGVILGLWFLLSGPHPAVTAGIEFVIALALIALGASTMLAYAQWERAEEGRLHPPTPEQEAAREQRRLRRGRIVGLCLVLVSVLMIAYPLLAAAEVMQSSQRVVVHESWHVRVLHVPGLHYDRALSMMVQQNIFDYAVYFSIEGLLFVAGVMVALGYAFAEWRWRRAQRRRTRPAIATEETRA